MTQILNGKWIDLSQEKVLTGEKMLKTAKYGSIKMIMMMDLAQHGLKRVKSTPKMGEKHTENG